MRTDAATLVDLHLTRMAYADAVRSGRLTVEGPRDLVRGFRSWFRSSPFAPFIPAETARN